MGGAGGMGTGGMGTGGTGGKMSSGGSDAGTDAGNAGGGGGSGEACGFPPSCLAPGLFPPSNIDQIKCGEVVQSAATKAEATGLDDGSGYTVLIAAYDAYGNVGTFSETVCGTPVPVRTFWEQYCSDNPDACHACGLCSVQVDDTTPLVPAFLGAGLGVSALVLRRRSRRKQGGSR